MGGGPIGLSAVAVLKILGYGPIGLIEPVRQKREIALAYGAEGVFDPGAADLRQQLAALCPGGFDKVFECAGIPANVGLAVEVAADCGQVCIVSVMFRPVDIPMPFLVNFKEVRLTASISNTHGENIQCLAWMASGRLDARPMISHETTLAGLPGLYREVIDPGLAVKAMVRIGDPF